MGKQVKVGGGESKNRLKCTQEFHTCWQMSFRYWRKTDYSKNSVEQLVSILKQKWAGGCLPSPDSKSNSSWIRALTKEPISPRGTRRNHGGMRGRVRLFLAISGWRGQPWQQHGSGQTWPLSWWKCLHHEVDKRHESLRFFWDSQLLSMSQRHSTNKFTQHK